MGRMFLVSEKKEQQKNKMAPLQVIGAGYGRTGTTSLCEALNKLGYRTHHMKEFIKRPELDASVFTEAYKHPEKPVDWDKIYEDYTAAVDVPTCLFLDKLIEKYPDAKFILTVRSPESWYESMKNTILPACKWMEEAEDLPPHRLKMKELIDTIVLDGAIKDEQKFYEDKENIKEFFVKHNEWTKSIIPQDKLLIMELGDGWEKLCPFLGKDIPDEPYPHSNSTAELKELQAKALVEHSDPKAATAAVMEKFAKLKN